MPKPQQPTRILDFRAASTHDLLALSKLLLGINTLLAGRGLRVQVKKRPALPQFSRKSFD